MSEFSVTATGIAAGVWTGIVTAPGAQPPDLEIVQDDAVIARPALAPLADGAWRLEVAIPAARLDEGLTLFVIRARGTQERLDSFTVIAGRPVEGELHAEVAALRAELELLKAAFRHQNAPHET